LVVHFIVKQANAITGLLINWKAIFKSFCFFRYRNLEEF